MSWVRSTSFRKIVKACFPWLTLALFALIAGNPLLSATTVLNGNDTAFHYWRAVEAERLLRAGVVFPRWAPSMAGGYGYPLFIFQGPFSAQFSALLHIVGFAWPSALNGTYFLGLFASALTVFVLGRYLWGEQGGLGAGILFLFIPYHLYVLYFRSSLSETVGLALPPLVLWGLSMWAKGRRRGLVVGVLALTGLALTHSVSLYLFTPLFILWIVSETFSADCDMRWQVLARMVGLLALGFLSGLFAWLPGLMERDAVQLGRATSAWVFDYRANFLPLSQLLALPRNADPLLLNDWPARGLGALFVLVALASLFSWSSQSRERKIRLVVLSVGALSFTFLATPWARPLWDRVPLLSAFQFPWRFLAPAALAMTLLIGAGLQWLFDRVRGAWLWILMIVVLTVSHWGWLYPPISQLPGPASTAGMMMWEHASATLGTTASNELLPRWVERLPDSENPVTQALLRDEEPKRLDPSQFPAGTRVIRADYSLLSGSVELETPLSFHARWLAFYYPGWRVQVDGQSVVVEPETETGLLTFQVPAGRHVIKVSFEATPRWKFADITSLLALIVTVFVAGLSRDARGLRPQRVDHPHPTKFPLFCIGTAGLLVLGKFLVVDHIPTPLRHTALRADGQLANVETVWNVNFGDRLLLLGSDISARTFPADVGTQMTLFWRALNPERYDWQMGMTLVSLDGHVSIPVRLRPLRWGRSPGAMYEWPASAYARFDSTLDLSPGTPPGDYVLHLSLFDRETLVPASVLGPDGNPQAPTLTLGQVRVERPRDTPTLSALQVPEDATLTTCGVLGLWSMTADRVFAAPGDVIALRWVWEALEAPDGDLEIDLLLRDANGTTIKHWTQPPVAVWWPTSRWQQGDRWVGQSVVRLPGALEDGEYELALSLCDCALLASVGFNVEAPPRMWTVPDDFIVVDTLLGDSVRLFGYQWEPVVVMPGDLVRVTLAWEALADMELSYRVFVHLIDDEGQILAQSDGEPAGWTRPTTGWAPGEIVLDTREIPVPTDAAPGPYKIYVGMYEFDGLRLITPEGQDAILLGEVVVGTP